MHTVTPSIPSVMTNEQHGPDNVTVILEWTKQQLTSYNIEITPDTVVRESSDSSRQRAQLTVTYNIMYSVRFVASPCGHNTTVTKIFELLYGKCLHTN